MKHGKNPTKKQSILLKEKGINSSNWLISKCTVDYMILIHRNTGTVRKVII